MREVMTTASRTTTRSMSSTGQGARPLTVRSLHARTLIHQATMTTLNRLSRTTRVAFPIFAMIGVHDYWRTHSTEELRFLAFCGSMRHLAHGQILQDLWVLFELDLKIEGYFVEF